MSKPDNATSTLNVCTTSLLYFISTKTKVRHIEYSHFFTLGNGSNTGTQQMSEPTPAGGDQTNPETWLEPGGRNVQLVYFLYLLSFVVGFSGLIGLVFAYMNRSGRDALLDSHYTYQIRTFWIGMLYSIICVVLAIIGIGFLLMFAVAIWAIVRCIKGLQAISKKEPIDNVETWLV